MLGFDFSSLLLSFSFSSVEAIFMDFSKAYLLLNSESPGWKESADFKSCVKRH